MKGRDKKRKTVVFALTERGLPLAEKIARSFGTVDVFEPRALVSGGLKKEVELGDLVVSTGAVRLENTTSFFVHEGYPAVPHYEVTLALIQAARENGFRFHAGLTATAPGFYGAQARNIPGFPPRDPDLLNKLAAQNVINIEMEASALFVLSQLKGFRAGAVCAVYGNRHANKFIDEKTMKEAERRCIETGLGAVKILSKGIL